MIDDREFKIGVIERGIQRQTNIYRKTKRQHGKCIESLIDRYVDKLYDLETGR